MSPAKKITKKATISGRVTVNFGVLGEPPKQVAVPKGATYADFEKKFGLAGLTVNLNGEKNPSKSHILTDGDTIVAVPQVKGGC